MQQALDLGRGLPVDACQGHDECMQSFPRELALEKGRKPHCLGLPPLYTRLGDLYVLTSCCTMVIPDPSSVASSLKLAAEAALPIVPFACVGECAFLPPPFFLCAMPTGKASALLSGLSPSCGQLLLRADLMHIPSGFRSPERTTKIGTSGQAGSGGRVASKVGEEQQEE